MNRELALSKLQRSAQAGTWLLDLVRNEVWWSEGMFAVLRLPPGTSTPQPGTSIDLYCEPKWRPLMQRVLQDAIADGNSWDFEFDATVADGEVRIMRTTGEPVREAGRIVGVVGVLMDIDDRRRAERALAEREQRFRAIFNSTFQFIGLLRPDGTVLEINEPALAEIGFDVDELFGRNFLDTVLDGLPPERRAQFAAAAKRAAGGEFVRFQFDAPARRGWVTLDFSLKPILDTQGKVTLLVGEARDISALRVAERAQRESERRFRDMFERAPIGMAMIDLEGRFIAVNQTLSDLVGYSIAELTGGMFSHQLRPLEEVQANLPLIRDLLEGRISSLRVDGRYIHKDGHTIDMQIDGVVMRDDTGVPHSLMLQLQDITQRKHFADVLFDEKELAQVTLASIADGVIRTDAAGFVTYCNAAALRLLGRDEGGCVGRPFGEIIELFSERTQEPITDVLRAAAGAEPLDYLPAFTLLKTASGELRPVEESIAPVRNRAGERIGSVFVFHDVTQTRALASQLLYQASHDPLTGLPNRREFETELTGKLFSARARDLTHALLYLDLDRFKLVNDTCGHSAGDRMLRELARELRKRLRASDLIARLGGDEFALILDTCPVERALAIATDLVETTERFRFSEGGRTFQVGASIGVALIDAQTADVNQALSRADTACYIAKRRGRNRVQLYERSDEEVVRAQHDMDWVTRIEEALDEGRIVLFAQRIEPIGSNALASYEVLVRQRDPSSQIVLPAHFLPAAQRFGLMGKIDREVVRRALDKILELERAAKAPNFGYLSINLSGTSLSDVEFLNFLQHELEARRTPPERVRFEITETAAVHDLAAARGFISGLRSQGYKIFLDDFGTGFTSFEYLKSLEVDGLKIDQSFTRDLAVDTINQTIVESICKIGQRLQLEIIAEGVEDEATLAALRSLGVEYAQGWLFHKAEPIDLVLPSTPILAARA